MVKFDIMKNLLSYGFGDSMRMGASEIIAAGVCRATGMERAVVLPQQTHSANVAIVKQCHIDRLLTGGRQAYTDILGDTDALITQLPGLWIGVRTADCVPVLLCADDIRAVAAIHAGWKGTRSDIVGTTVRQLVEMGADMRRIRAYIGPCICADCYEVSPQLAEAFREAGLTAGIMIPPIASGDMAGISQTMDSRPHLDLRECNRLRLVGAGLTDSDICISNYCTRHTRLNTAPHAAHPFYSYRRNPGESGRDITAIRLILS